MNINRNLGQAAIFDNIRCGDVFMTMGHCYMKVNNPNDMNNAVNLFDGDLCHFKEMQLVYRVDYEFTIK